MVEVSRCDAVHVRYARHLRGLSVVVLIKWNTIWTTLCELRKDSVKSTKTTLPETMMNTSQFSSHFIFASKIVCGCCYCCRLAELPLSWFSLRVAWFSKSFLVIHLPSFSAFDLRHVCINILMKKKDEKNVYVCCVWPAALNSIPFHFILCAAKHHSPHHSLRSNGCVTFIDSLTSPASNQILMPL